MGQNKAKKNLVGMEWKDMYKARKHASSLKILLINKNDFFSRICKICKLFTPQRSKLLTHFYIHNPKSR